MKKFMLALLAGVMMFGLASQAMAEVTVGGDIELRYDLWNNLDLGRGWNENTARTQTQNFFANRILLHVDAKVTEGLEGYIELASESDGLDERTWGHQSASAGDVSPMNYQGERVAIRQAWINFMVPGLPVGMKIGHQPLALGHGISLDSHRMGQDAILLYSKPIPELLVAGVYVKAAEFSSSIPASSAFSGLTGAEHQDVDVYAALANYTFMENNTVGMYYLYGHDARDVPGVGGGISTVDRIHWIGLVADGAVGPVNYKGEFVYQDINATVGGTEVGINHAWAAMLGAGTKLALVDLNLEAAYGTGTNPNKNVDSRTFLTPYGTTSYNYAFLYNDKLGQNPFAGFPSVVNPQASAFGTNLGWNNELAFGGLGLSDGTGGFGLANTGYLKLSAAVNPMERMTADMAVLYLMASSPAFNGQSRDLGWEVDAHVGYDIYDNLALDLTGGVFIPGAWYAFNGVVSGPGAPSGTVVDENDPTTSLKRSIAYGLETKLTMKF